MAQLCGLHMVPSSASPRVSQLSPGRAGRRQMFTLDTQVALNALWFNRGVGPKLKSFILVTFYPVCNGGFIHRIM